MKYEAERFNEENAPVKRQIEQEFISKCIKYGIKGNVLGLAGPEIKAHYNNYKRIVGNKDRIIICEQDREIFQHQKSFKSEMPRLTLHCEDIFKRLSFKQPPLALLDLDFCCNIETIYEQGFQRSLTMAFRNNKFKQKFGLIISFSKRCSYVGDDQLKSFIIRLARKNMYVKTYAIEEPYRDNSVMETWLICFKKATNKEIKSI